MRSFLRSFAQMRAAKLHYALSTCLNLDRAIASAQSESCLNGLTAIKSVLTWWLCVRAIAALLHEKKQSWDSG